MSISSQILPSNTSAENPIDSSLTPAQKVFAENTLLSKITRHIKENCEGHKALLNVMVTCKRGFEYGAPALYNRGTRLTFMKVMNNDSIPDVSPSTSIAAMTDNLVDAKC